MRKERYWIAFALGFIVVGVFDFVYTSIGGQRYSDTALFLSYGNWPLHVPLQMGLVAVVILFLWERLKPLWRGLGVPLDSGLRRPMPLALAVIILLAGMGLAVALLGHELHALVFVGLLAASIIFLAIRGNRHELLAFALIGTLGGAAEWFLLDPSVNYWRFAHTELFYRLPAWEPFIYGWIGVTIQRLSDPTVS